MRAVRVYEFDLNVPMQVDEVDDPRPEAGEILVKVGAAGLNPSDIATRTGKHPFSKFLTPPYIPGNEASGEIVELGEGVEDFEKGQKVFGGTMGGAYAEIVRMKASGVIPLPDGFSYGQGAGIRISLLTSWNALVLKDNVQPGETVLVQGGAGGVGMTTIQLAKHLGCRVFATVSTDEKADYCRKLGADEVINYKEEDFVERCKQLTDDKGLDAIVELVACDNFDKDMDAIRIGGRILLIGTGTGKGPMTQFRVPAAMVKDAHIMGMSGLNLGPQVPGMVRDLTPLLNDGVFDIHVEREFSIDESNEAHQFVLGGKFFGKIVVVP